jgi:phytol kinase
MLSKIVIEFPSPRVVIFGALLALVWSYSCLRLAAYLKTKLGIRTGDTRKLFHVLIFISAFIVQVFGGLVAVCVFGTMVSLVVGLAVLRGPNDGLYEALAREQDEPSRTYYIVIPHFATMIGGLASNIFFGPLALVGYLVGGLGDAAGEPVGTRWGRHRYVNNAKVTKTLEGSIAVLTASVVALLIAVAITPGLHFSLQSAIALPLIAMVCTLVEALSPRGWDNVFMQIVPTLLVATLLSR